MEKKEIFEALFLRISQKKKNTPFRIAVNGIEGVGKTTFAGMFTDFLRKKGASAFHISIDGFHNPKSLRYRQGRESAKGYYDDAYNEKAFVEKVLLQSQEKFSFVPAIHDLKTDENLSSSKVIVPQGSFLITDGAYLLKDIYFPHWDFTIYLKTSFDIARKRAVQRDSAGMGREKNAEEKLLKRYHLASQMYIEQVQPETKADVILDNSDVDAPFFIK